MKEKLMELCKNKEFAEKLNSLKTEEEVIEYLKSNGVEVNSFEELKALAQPESGELNVDELNQATGGSACLIIGLGAFYNACYGEGDGYNKSSGLGATACMILGVGAGFILG